MSSESGSSGMEAVSNLLLSSRFPFVGKGNGNELPRELLGNVTYTQTPYDQLGPLVEIIDSVPFPSALAEDLVRRDIEKRDRKGIGRFYDAPRNGGNIDDVTMGLLPELGRAWIAAQNCLYFWNYRDELSGNSEGTYECVLENLSDDVVTVSLCRAKADAFESNISHVLVVVTVAEVLLLEVNEELGGKLCIRKSSYRCNSDEGFVISACGSPDGRIFLLGSDSVLYELEYDAGRGLERRTEGGEGGWMHGWVDSLRSIIVDDDCEEGEGSWDMIGDEVESDARRERLYSNIGGTKGRTADKDTRSRSDVRDNSNEDDCLIKKCRKVAHPLCNMSSLQRLIRSFIPPFLSTKGKEMKFDDLASTAKLDASHPSLKYLRIYCVGDKAQALYALLPPLTLSVCLLTPFPSISKASIPSSSSNYCECIVEGIVLNDPVLINRYKAEHTCTDAMEKAIQGLKRCVAVNPLPSSYLTCRESYYVPLISQTFTCPPLTPDNKLLCECLMECGSRIVLSICIVTRAVRWEVFLPPPLPSPSTMKEAHISVRSSLSLPSPYSTLLLAVKGRSVENDDRMNQGKELPTEIMYDYLLYVAGEECIGRNNQQRQWCEAVGVATSPSSSLHGSRIQDIQLDHKIQRDVHAHSVCQPNIYVLSNEGITIYKKKTPRDIILSILTSMKTSANFPARSSLSPFEQAEMLKNHMGSKWACLECLLLACDNHMDPDKLTPDLRINAVKLAVEWGGKATVTDDGKYVCYSSFLDALIACLRLKLVSLWDEPVLAHAVEIKAGNKRSMLSPLIFHELKDTLTLLLKALSLCESVSWERDVAVSQLSALPFSLNPPLPPALPLSLPPAKAKHYAEKCETYTVTHILSLIHRLLHTLNLLECLKLIDGTEKSESALEEVEDLSHTLPLLIDYLSKIHLKDLVSDSLLNEIVIRRITHSLCDVELLNCDSKRNRTMSLMQELWRLSHSFFPSSAYFTSLAVSNVLLSLSNSRVLGSAPLTIPQCISVCVEASLTFSHPLDVCALKGSSASGKGDEISQASLLSQLTKVWVDFLENDRAQDRSGSFHDKDVVKFCCDAIVDICIAAAFSFAFPQSSGGQSLLESFFSYKHCNTSSLYIRMQEEKKLSEKAKIGGGDGRKIGSVSKEEELNLRGRFYEFRHWDICDLLEESNGQSISKWERIESARRASKMACYQHLANIMLKEFTMSSSILSHMLNHTLSHPAAQNDPDLIQCICESIIMSEFTRSANHKVPRLPLQLFEHSQSNASKGGILAPPPSDHQSHIAALLLTTNPLIEAYLLKSNHFECLYSYYIIHGNTSKDLQYFDKAIKYMNHCASDAESFLHINTRVWMHERAVEALGCKEQKLGYSLLSDFEGLNNEMYVHLHKKCAVARLTKEIMSIFMSKDWTIEMTHEIADFEQMCMGRQRLGMWGNAREILEKISLPLKLWKHSVLFCVCEMVSVCKDAWEPLIDDVHDIMEEEDIEVDGRGAQSTTNIGSEEWTVLNSGKEGPCLVENLLQAYIYSLVPMRSASSEGQLFLDKKRTENSLIGIIDNSLLAELRHSCSEALLENVNAWTSKLTDNLATFGQEMISLIRYVNLDDEAKTHAVQVCVSLCMSELLQIASTLHIISRDERCLSSSTLEPAWVGKCVCKWGVPPVILVDLFVTHTYECRGLSPLRQASLCASLTYTLAHWASLTQDDVDFDSLERSVKDDVVGEYIQCSRTILSSLRNSTQAFGDRHVLEEILAECQLQLDTFIERIEEISAQI